MSIKLDKVYDEKLKATVYTLKKTDENKKSGVIRVIDYGNNGLDNTDGITVQGSTSVFTNDEIKNNLFSNYKNTGTKSNLDAVEYSSSDGKLDINNGKVYSLGSFAETTGASPAAANTTAATTPSVPYTMPNLNALSTGMQFMDTSMFDGYGMNTNTTASMGNLNYAKAQEAMNTYNGIGALFGILSSLGGDNDMLTSSLLPMMMGSFLPDYGNFFNTPKVNTTAPNTTTTNTNSNTQNTSATAPAPVTAQAPAKTPTQAKATTPDNTKIVADTEKEYKELAKTQPKKETVKHTDGAVSTTNRNGNKVIQKFKNGTLVEETEYYRDGSFNKTQHSEIKGAVYQKGETVGVNKDGLQIRKYTKDGSRIVEARRNGKLIQTDAYQEDGSTVTTVTGKAAVKTSSSALRYVDNQHLLSYVQCLDDEHLKNFFFGK